MASIQSDLPWHKKYELSLLVGDPGEIRLICGDITQYSLDAIVNAANSELLPGGGVCGAIHRAGGPAIAAECHKIRLERGPIRTGEAVPTTAGRLNAKCVIHTVGPIWQGGEHREAESLSNCYREAMRIADQMNLHSIAFPAISTGIFGYPIELATRVALPSLIEGLRLAEHLVLVLLVLFDQATLEAFATAAIAQREPASGHPYRISIAHYD